MAPLRELLKKNQLFDWDDNTNIAFQKLKAHIPKAHNIPCHTMRDLPVTTQTDDRKHGQSVC